MKFWGSRLFLKFQVFEFSILAWILGFPVFFRNFKFYNFPFWHEILIFPSFSEISRIRAFQVWLTDSLAHRPYDAKQKPEFLRPYRFSLMKSHFRLQNCQNFRLRRANDTHTKWCGRARRRRRKNWLLEVISVDFHDLFPPQDPTPWGGNFYFPPKSERLGGEMKKYFPPTLGGEKSTPGHPLWKT